MTKKGGIAGRLRDRILSGIEAGTLRGGDKLPSSRELASEFGADPRVIAAAYRTLCLEALVEIRPKSGVYVSPNACPRALAERLPVNWLADVFVDAVRKGLPISELGSVVFDFAETRRIRAAVVADTTDQAVGISAELKREYGLTASPHHLDDMLGSRLPPKLAAARVFFAANDCASAVIKVARPLRRQVIAISIRPDIFDAEWLSLIRGQVYVVATDSAFVEKLPRIFPDTKAVENVKVMLVGRDDLSTIPPNAPTYVTENARRAIGTMRLPGRIIRPRRLFADSTVRDIVQFIMSQNAESI